MLALAKVLWKAAQYSTALSYVHSALVHASVSHHDAIAIEALIWASSCWEMLCPNLQQETNDCTKVSLFVGLLPPMYSLVLVWEKVLLNGKLHPTGAIATYVISTAATLMTSSTSSYIYDHACIYNLVVI